MKILRWVTTVIFTLVLCGYLLFSWNEYRNKDFSYPVVKLISPEIEVSIRTTRDELLEGVTAYDEKDGDLTDKLLVESISQFIEKGICKVTYAVADADSHVAKATRKMRYTDYTSPQFTLEKPMVFYVDQKVDIRKLVGAQDCLDGDVSEKVTFLDSDYIRSRPGAYSVQVQYINRRGDRIEESLPIYVQQNDPKAPQITLTDGLIYIGRNQQIDYRDYIDSVTLDGKPYDLNQVEISVLPDGKNYQVHYQAEDDTKEHTGHTVLTVIVEE